MKTLLGKVNVPDCAIQTSRDTWAPSEHTGTTLSQKALPHAHLPELWGIDYLGHQHLSCVAQMHQTMQKIDVWIMP